MNVPANLKYSATHEWVEVLENGNVRIGITDFAQDALSDLVFVNLPEVGDEVTVGKSFGDVESVKAVSDLISPVSGTVTAINEDLLDAPQAMNETPYEAWMIEVSDVTETEALLDDAGYAAKCEAED